jgi:hypothetical protein
MGWMQNPFAQDMQGNKDAHEMLEHRIAGFTKEFREVKDEVFKITEAVIHSDWMSKLPG